MKELTLILLVITSSQVQSLKAQTTPSNLVTSITVGANSYDMLAHDTMSVYVTLSTTLGGYVITLKTLNPYSTAFAPTSIKYLGGGVYKCLITNDGNVYNSFCTDVTKSYHYVMKALIKRTGYDSSPVLQSASSIDYTVNQICTIPTSIEMVDQPQQDPVYFNLYGNVVNFDETGFYIVKTGNTFKKIWKTN